MSRSPCSELGFSSAPPLYMALDSKLIKLEPNLGFDEVQPVEDEKNIQQNKDYDPNNSCPPIFAPVYCQICQSGPFSDIPSLQHHTISAHSTTLSPDINRPDSIEEEKYSTMDENIANASFDPEDKHKSVGHCQSQFTCQQCQATFEALAQFINHMRVKHLAPNKISPVLIKHLHCSICKKEFGSAEKKVEHMVQHFISTTSIYSCHCASKFATPHQLQQHFLVSHTQMLYRCAVCLQLFTDNIAYQRHTVQHVHETISYNCVICEISFQSMDSLSTHVQLTHDKLDSNVQSMSTTYNPNESQQPAANPNTKPASMAVYYEDSHEDSDVSNKYPPTRLKYLHKTQKKIHIKNGHRRRRSEHRNGFKCQICDVVFPGLYVSEGLPTLADADISANNFFTVITPKSTKSIC
uniref:C2H2-type domain-containing protein n=1 Tax=Ditylenchus dipsaci TaxID=166011 RepID=A0A915CW69_9BILA